MFVKEFMTWLLVKERLDAAAHRPPHVNEGDLWWCAIGENVGVEVSGKGSRFTRPVIVLRKFGRLAFLGIPITTKQRDGSWYVPFKHRGVREIAMLTQARAFSYLRLDKKIGRLDDEDFKKVKEAFLSLFTQ